MQQLRIYFDIDKTMIDTHLLLVNCQASLATVGVLPDTFQKTLNEYYGTLPNKTFFDPDIFLQNLAETSAVNLELITRTFWLAGNFSSALFPEVIPVLEKLKERVALATFSQGVKTWQEKKLTLCGLDQYFLEENRIIESDKISSTVLNRLEQDSWVIDDKEIVVEALQTARPDLTVFWINRNQETTSSKQSIQSLTEVADLIRQN